MAAPTAAGKSVTGCGSTLPGTSTDIAFFGPLKSPCEFFFSFHISIINIYLFPSRICVLFYIYIFVLPSFSMPCFALIVPSVLGKFSYCVYVVCFVDFVVCSFDLTSSHTRFGIASGLLLPSREKVQHVLCLGHTN